jgi:hypothetical protein
VIVARDFPPRLWASDMVEALQRHSSEAAWKQWHEHSYRAAGIDRIPLSAVRNFSSGPLDHTNEAVIIEVDDTADPNQVLAALRSPETERERDFEPPRMGLRQEVNVHLGAPLSDLLRAWVQRSRDVSGALQKLREALG